MAIAPDDLQLKPASRTAVLTAPRQSTTEEADSALWQEDCAAAISSEEKASAKEIRIAGGPKYAIIFWLVLLHVGALAAPFCFSWQAAIVAYALYWLAGSTGVCLGYHRLLTHGAFKVHRPTRWLIAFIGGLSGEGCAIDWVANHRKHHAHSDHDGDPHSPREGGWWSHAGWLGFATHEGEGYEKHIQRWAPDLAKDPMMRWVGYMFLPSHILSGLVLLGIGYWLGGSAMAVSFLVWGLFVRLVAVLHVTWFVNSWAHMWGYRNYETTDDSRNNWLVALLAFGEGWHNNHHAYPRMATHRHKWWEFDPTFLCIRLMQWTGLAWDVVDYKRASDRDND
jgi:stearoyl-CoA desaturase (delta-9 desaturase)